MAYFYFYLSIGKILSDVLRYFSPFGVVTCLFEFYFYPSM